MKPRTIILFPIRLPVVLFKAVIDLAALPTKTAYKATIRSYWNHLKGEYD